MAKKKSVVRRLGDSKAVECFLARRLLSAVLGFSVGYAYHKVSFAHAFGPDEEYYANMVKWGVLGAATIGCAVSTQCSCIAALCIPTMSAKSGRSFLQALIVSWILAGPMVNIMYHSKEAIRSMSCIAELQDRQTGVLIDLIKTPILKGLFRIVNESSSLDHTQKNLDGELTDLQKKLLTTAFGKDKAEEQMDEHEEKIKLEQEKRARQKEVYDDDDEDEEEEEEENDQEVEHRQKQTEDVVFENETKVEPATVGYDLGGEIKSETEYRCISFFDKTYDECLKVSGVAWDSCMNKFKVPLISHIICQIMWNMATGRCDKYIKDKRDKNCNDSPEFDEDEVNKNYSEIDSAVKGTDQEFDMKLYWEGKELDEVAALLTVKEITHTIKEDYSFHMMIMNTIVLFAQKVVAVTVIFVLYASAAYSGKYLTDFRYDNNYVTTYFVHKDNERKHMTKRSLLPLTKLENKYVVRPTDFKFSVVEKKSMLFKFIRLVIQSVFTAVLFLLDYVIYFILALIVKHGHTEFALSGKHKMEVHVEGNGTLAAIVTSAFAPFEDNEHTINDSYTNEECLPVVKPMPQYMIDWTIGCHVALLLLIMMEGYLLRLRRIICALFYPKREKRRIIFLYNELLRQRKQEVFAVRKAVLKLALVNRLNQKYSFFEALRLRYPKLGKIMKFCGKGKLRCLICETPESARQPLWRCSNIKCRMLYCHICWVEVQEMCWACNSARGADRKLPDDETPDPPLEIASDEDEEGLANGRSSDEENATDLPRNAAE